MPRPKLRSDESVLDAALGVLLREGPAGFTLAAVAEAVGLSRATIVQRFGDKGTLHRRVMERRTHEVRSYLAGDGAAFGPGLDGAWGLLRDLIDGMGSGAGTEGYLLLMWGDVREPDLRALAAERNRLVVDAIAERLPTGPHDPRAAATLVQSVVHGACVQWLVQPRGRLADFMTDQTRAALQALYPDHDFA